MMPRQERECPICHAPNLKNLVHHLGAVHGMKRGIERRSLLRRNTKIVPDGDDEYIPGKAGAQSVQDYLDPLREFQMLSKEQKRLFIKNRAPSNFIKMMAEILYNIAKGALGVNLDDFPDCKYNIERILSKKLSRDRIRRQLSSEKMIRCLHTVVPYVMTHISKLS